MAKGMGQNAAMEVEKKFTIVAGSGNRRLAESIAEPLGVGLCRCTVTRFPDSEIYVELGDSVRGCNVYVVQPTGPTGRWPSDGIAPAR